MFTALLGYTYAYTYAMGGSDGTYPLSSNSTSVEENESFILFYLLFIRLHYNLCLYSLDIRIDTFYILYIYKSVVIHQHISVDKYIILNVLQVEQIQETRRDFRVLVNTIIRLGCYLHFIVNQKLDV